MADERLPIEYSSLRHSRVSGYASVIGLGVLEAVVIYLLTMSFISHDTPRSSDVGAVSEWLHWVDIFVFVAIGLLSLLNLPLYMLVAQPPRTVYREMTGDTASLLENAVRNELNELWATVRKDDDT